MSCASDAWANDEAATLLVDLAARGIDVSVQAGLLVVRPASALSDADVRLLRIHRDDLKLLALACTDAVLDRLSRLRAGQHHDVRRARLGACYTCGEPLQCEGPAVGRCGPCAVAARIWSAAPVTADALARYAADVRGPASTSRPGLFDQAARA